MKIAFKNSNSNLKSIYFLIGFIPLWWILGVKLVIFHLVVFLAFSKIVLTFRGRVRLTKSHIYLAFFIMIYILSLIINPTHAEFSRVVGSAYNLSFWVMGLAIMIIVQNTSFNYDQMFDLSRTLRKLGLSIGLVSLFSIGYWFVFMKELKFNSLLASLAELPTSFFQLQSSVTLNFVRSDWFFNRPVPRLIGFFSYPTELSIVITIVILFTFLYYKIVKTQVSKVRKLGELILMSLALIFSTSRIVFVGMAFSLIFVHFLSYSKTSTNRFAKQMFFRVILMVMIIFMAYFLITVDFTTAFLNSREGSTNFRLAIYLEAISTAIEYPFLGIGLKYTDTRYFAPIGSHSTLVGSFLKTGIIGSFFLVMFKTSLFLIWYKTKKYVANDVDLQIWKVIGNALLIYTIWMLTEDIDAPIIAAFLYFLICSIVLRFYTFLKNKKLDTCNKSPKGFEKGVLG